MSGNLSLCAMAMLAVIVDRQEANITELREAVGLHSEIAQWIGHPWPSDASEWIDELQALLDRNYVVRIPADHEYRYQPTNRGNVLLRAHLHVRGISMRSAS